MHIEHIGIHGNNLNYKKIGKILRWRKEVNFDKGSSFKLCMISSKSIMFLHAK